MAKCARLEAQTEAHKQQQKNPCHRIWHYNHCYTQNSKAYFHFFVYSIKHFLPHFNDQPKWFTMHFKFQFQFHVPWMYDEHQIWSVKISEAKWNRQLEFLIMKLIEVKMDAKKTDVIIFIRLLLIWVFKESCVWLLPKKNNWIATRDWSHANGIF